LSRRSGVPLDTAQYLGVPARCYAKCFARKSIAYRPPPSRQQVTLR
jgi:hypothetical protein